MKNLNDLYIIKLDNKIYKIPLTDFYTFLNLDEKIYQTLINDETLTFNSIPIRYFLSALKNKYVAYSYQDNKNTYNIYTPDVENLKPEQQKRLYDITTNKYIDIEAINILNEKPKNLDFIELNETLKNYIQKHTDNILADSKIKALYIYHLLKKILILDKDDTHLDSTNIFNINTITPENNNTTSIEFIYIYIKFLEELNIGCHFNFEIDNQGNINTTSQNKYPVLNLRLKNILLDIMPKYQEDFQKEMTITCTNKNQKTIEEFKKVNTKIKDLVEKTIKNPTSTSEKSKTLTKQYI